MASGLSSSRIMVLAHPSMQPICTRDPRKSGAVGNQSRSCLDRKWSELIDPRGIGTYLRAIHPQKTAQCVAARCSLPIDSVKKWLNGESTPGFMATMVLIGAYGPEFLHSLFRQAPAWVSAAASEHKLRRIEEQITTLQAELEHMIFDQNE